MSTKAIRHALDILRDSYQEATSSNVVPGEVVSAMAEVEAIERAACALALGKRNGWDSDVGIHGAFDLMESIAKDMP